MCVCVCVCVCVCGYVCISMRVCLGAQVISRFVALARDLVTFHVIGTARMCTQVFNSRSVRKDALVGTFKLDVGLVYEQEQHTFARKWLMLSNPKEPAAGVKGFLKVCKPARG